MKSGTITLAQLKGKPKEAEKPVLVKKDDKQISREAFLKRKAQVKELGNMLHATYAEVFDYENPKPLAIGIDKVIKTTFLQFSHKTVKFFMVKWVRRPKYLKAMISSEHRVDLNNLLSSAITDEQKKIAQDLLDKKETVKSRVKDEPV